MKLERQSRGFNRHIKVFDRYYVHIGDIKYSSFQKGKYQIYFEENKEAVLTYKSRWIVLKRWVLSTTLGSKYTVSGDIELGNFAIKAKIQRVVSVSPDQQRGGHMIKISPDRLDYVMLCACVCLIAES